MNVNSIDSSLPEISGWVSLPSHGQSSERRVFLRLSEGVLHIRNSETDMSTKELFIQGSNIWRSPTRYGVSVDLGVADFLFFCENESERACWFLSLETSSSFQLTDFYAVGNVIGKGSYGKVYTGRHRMSRTRVAIKTMRRMDVVNAIELNILKNNDHPNVMSTLDVLQTADHMHLVMPLMDGDLWSWMKRQKAGNEAQTREIIRQVLSGLHYLHSKKIVHLDLKPANIFIKQAESGLHCVIGDFGLSQIIQQGNQLSGSSHTVTTPAYAAPEHVDHQPFGVEVDLWACGVFMYEILTGSHPFFAFRLTKLFQKIKRGRVKLNTPATRRLSLEAKQLMSDMMESIPSVRITVTEALAHEWFS